MEKLPLTVKAKYITLLSFGVILLLFGGGGFYLSLRFPTPGDLRGVLGGGALLLISPLLIGLALYSRKLEILFIDHAGLTLFPNRPKRKIGVVPWEEITEIHLESYQQGRVTLHYMVIDVVNPIKYTTNLSVNQHKQLERLKVRLNTTTDNTLLLFTLNGAKIDQNELLSICQNEWHNHSHKASEIIPIATDLMDRKENAKRKAKRRAVLGLVLAGAGFFYLIGMSNQLWRSGLYNDTVYIMSNGPYSDAELAFDVESSIGKGGIHNVYIGFPMAEDPSTREPELKEIIQKIGDAAPHGTLKEKNSRVNLFKTEIKTSWLVSKDNWIEFEFANHEHIRLSNFKKVSDTQIEATYSDQTGTTFTAYITKEK